MIQQSPTERARELARRIVAEFRPAGWPAKENEIARLLERTYASQAAQPAEADGWVMVPRIMADEMREVFHDRVRILVTPAKRECEITNDQELWELVLAARPKAPAIDAGSALSEARVLIQEAKGLADGENGGSVTDHLDLAENWIGKAEAALAATPKAPATDAGGVAADCSCEVAFGQNEECPAHGTGTAWRAANPQADMRAQPYGQFTTPPAPNDNLRAAAEEMLAAFSEGVVWSDEQREAYAALAAALKENHRG